MFKKHQGRRSINIVFVIFRLSLSIVMFLILLVGIYSAYKHFSGLDPLKLDPQAVISNILAARTPQELVQILSKLKIDPKILGKPVENSQTNNQPGQEPSVNPEVLNPLFRFLIVSDSHNDNGNLDKAINQAKQSYPDLSFIIGLGDYSEVGTEDELKNAKAKFDQSNIRYFLIPGDHDLWDCRNRGKSPVACFIQVFGPSYQSFVFENFLFLLLDNSDNYTGFDDKQSEWIISELEKAKKDGVKGIFVFLHEPLYHPSSDHVMGWVEKSLKSQAGGLLFELKDAGVLKTFAGDIHYFSEYSEPKTNMEMMTIGAVTIERNPQAPRFAIVSVLEDGKTKVEDIEIK